MPISVKRLDLKGKMVDEVTFSNQQGMEVSFLNLGGIITRIMVPDNEGNLGNVVLSYEDYEGYLKNPAYFGAIIGRTAGRVQGGRFTLNEKKYALDKNYGPNSGQGGKEGFDKKIFNYTLSEDDERVSAVLSCCSGHMEEGYPGEVAVRVTYTLTDENAFRVDFEAVPTEDTLINLTNHSYFNLSGDFEESIKYHELFISSDKFTELDESEAPTGRLLDTRGTPFDFNYQKEIGEDMDDDHIQLAIGKGYDHAFLLKEDAKVKARLAHRFSGRVMEIETDNQALVVYTQNYSQGQVIGNKKVLADRKSVALEVQRLPIGHGESFKEFSIVRKGDVYKNHILYRFFVESSSYTESE